MNKKVPMKSFPNPKLDRKTIGRYVAATAGHYKKSGKRARMRTVTKQVRQYAQNKLPDLLIGRRDPIVLATEDEDFK